MKNIIFCVVLSLFLISCAGEERTANVLDSYSTQITVQNVPKDIKSGTTIEVIKKKQPPYEYVYVKSGGTSKAIIK